MKITTDNIKILESENGISYGDVISGVDFNYAKKLTAVNAINLASLGLESTRTKKM